jgi:Ca2+/H+ antiporter
MRLRLGHSAVGVVIALLVLLPETLAAVRDARRTGVATRSAIGRESAVGRRMVKKRTR